MSALKFGIYETHDHKLPRIMVDVARLVRIGSKPLVKQYPNIPAIAQHDGQGKTRDIAWQSNFVIITIDHDDDNKTKEQITQLYNHLGVGYFAYTSSSHMLAINKLGQSVVPVNRWKVVIPLATACDAATFERISKGIAHSLCTDPKQAQAQQIVYIPNKIAPDAPYEFINGLGNGGRWLQPDDDSIFMVEAAQGWKELQAAELAKMKPKPAKANGQGGIIEKIIEGYSNDIGAVLLKHKYQRKGHKFLAPNSTSGAPAVTILERDGKQVVYSHHSSVSDPLSAENHNGHALDIADVICALDFKGDFSAMISEHAQMLDKDANDERQKEYAIADQQAKTLALLTEQAKHCNTEVPNIDITKPHGLLGDICELMSLSARRDVPELYPTAGLHLMSLIGRKRASVLTERLSLLTLTIAASAAGKDNPQSVLRRLAKSLKMSDKLMGGIASHKDTIQNLVDADGTVLYSQDEVHTLFNAMHGKNSASYETKIEGEVLSQSTNEVYLFRGIDKRDLLKRLKDEMKQADHAYAESVEVEKAAQESGDDDAIYQAAEECRKRLRFLTRARRRVDYVQNGWPFPYFGLMGFSTPVKMDSITTDVDSIESGLLGRMLITRAGNGIPVVRTELNKGAILFAEQGVQQQLEGVQKRGEQRIDIAPDAAELLASYGRHFELDQHREHPTLGAIWRRAYEQTVKVASVLAVGKDEIERIDVEYANALVLNSLADLEHIIINTAANAEGADIALLMNGAKKTILKDARAGNGLTKRDITRHVTRNKQWGLMQDKEVGRDLLQEVLDELVGAGNLELITSGKAPRYKTLL